jgi:hypothetical protein
MMHVATQQATTPRQRRLVMTALGLTTLALPVAFVFLSDADEFRRPLLLVTLVALAACAYLGEVALKVSVPARFDARFALALVALAACGPLPAVVVFLTFDVMSRLVVREYRVFTPGALANLASYGCAVLAGATAQALTHDWISAGLTLAAVQFGVARLFYGTLYQGFRPGPLIRAEFLDILPAVLAMVLLASLAAMLVPTLGIVAIIAFAPVVLIPSLALPALTRHKSTKDLDVAGATALYAAALADVLRLTRDQRRIAVGAAHFKCGREFGPRPRSSELYDIGAAAFYATERFDGGGRPAGLGGGLIPIESRVVAVAAEWANLTARGTQQLSHAEALLALELDAATRLDPRVVAAAGEVVHSELPWATDRAFQPVLHRLPLPRPVRRAGLPRVLLGYVHA